MSKKRPCAICRQWFYPHPRVGDRQRVCSNPACQAQRRKKTQATWRAKNPDYESARKFQRRFMTTGEDQSKEPPQLQGMLRRLPWDLIQDEIGAKAAEIIMYLARQFQIEFQDQIRSYVRGNIGKNGRQPLGAEKDPMRLVVSLGHGGSDAETNHDMPRAPAPP